MARSDGLRIGIVGTGGLGTMLGEEFDALPGATVAAVADVADEHRERAADRFDVPAASRHAADDDMLAGDDLDGVVIATPHALHYDQVTAALDAGLHVLCEKPLVIDPARAAELRERAEAGDRVLMVGYQRHLDTSFRLAREWSADGPDVAFVTAEITQDWLASVAGTWRTDPDRSGGRFLIDTGSHVIDAVLWVTGLDPTAVTADMEFASPGVDRRASLVIEFEGGATATVSAFGDAPRVREELHVWDDEGAAYVRGREWDGRTLTLVDADGTERSPYLDRSAERNKAEAFVDAIRGEAPPPATARDAERAARVIDAAYESAESGERVGV